MSREILGVRFDHLTAAELEDRLINFLKGFEPKMIVTPNPEILLRARRDLKFRELLNSAHLSLPDGIGVRMASYLHREPLHRHTGTDALHTLARLCRDNKYCLVLLGGASDVAAHAARKLEELYEGLTVVPVDPGIVNEAQLISEAIIRKLKTLDPAVIAVALGAGKQERYLKSLSEHLPNLKIGIGVGGALDMISGKTRRAPKWMSRFGLEWMWRLWLEPRRIGRIFNAVIVFPIVVMFDKIKR